MNKIVYGLGLCLLSFGLQAAGVQDLRQLELKATTFLRETQEGGAYRYEAGKADSRVRLPACSTPLNAAWPPGQVAPFRALLLECPALGWRVMLPLTATELSMAYVSARQLKSGDVVQLNDIRLAPVTNRALLLQAIKDPLLIVGKAVRSTLPEGSLLRESQLQAPIVVKMNQPVRVLVVGGGFNVGSDAMSLSNGAIGDRVNVRVPSGKVISGVVQPDLSIYVQMP